MADSEIEDHRLAARVAGAQEDREITQFLGDLVRGGGDRGADAERDRRHDGGADDRAVDEGVEGVADDDEGGGGVVVHRAFIRLVAMAPDHQLFEHEEREDAAKQRAERGLRRQGIERFGNEVRSDAPSSVPTA